MNRTNCANCGAVLEYREKDYGNVLACSYCKTEYHIDKFGKFNEYYVEFIYMGKKVRGYIGDVKLQKLWYGDVNRTIDKKLHLPSSFKTMLDMQIIGEFIDE